MGNTAIKTSSIGGHIPVPQISPGCDKSLLLGDIHIWFFKITDAALKDTYNKCLEIISVQELQRSKEFEYSQRMRQYIVSKAIVRTVLSKYAPLPASGWRFVENEHGKPEIEDGICPIPLRFNLTHTDGLVACAVALDTSIGIDAEQIKKTENNLSIAKRFFTPAEYQNILDQPPENRKRRFYELWTLKEAYIKAIGKGLSCPLRSFSIDMTVPKSIGISFDEKPIDSPNNWVFHQAFIPPNHVVSVCIGNAAQRRPRFAVRRLDFL